MISSEAAGCGQKSRAARTTSATAPAIATESTLSAPVSRASRRLSAASTRRW